MILFYNRYRIKTCCFCVAAGTAFMEGTMQDHMESLKTVTEAYGIHFAVLGEHFEGIEGFDAGLRARLYQDYDYQGIVEQMEENCQKNKLYMVRDVFGLYYMMFCLPDSGISDMENRQYVMIGPYLQAGSEPEPLEVIEKLGLELYHLQILKNFYQGTVRMFQFENVVTSLVQPLFSEKGYGFAYSGLNLAEKYQDMRLRVREERSVPMEAVEERYRCENRLLDAVEQGDETEAMLAMAVLGRYGTEKRSSDSFRNDKNDMIILNVLLRKAVEKAGVHPYYIDELSSFFARRIEAAGNTGDIVQINREIIRKYCLLVRNHAGREYSELVNRCVSYIEFNLIEELSLKVLAERFYVSGSYLSLKFKKETGQTVTDFINEKRIVSSLPLLVTTRLPIGEVAEKVGILNENYYSRLFRKLQGMTPSEYRTRMTDSR